MVTVSCAVTSVPSLIAFMKLGGVIELEAQRGRLQREDALRGADRHAGVARADLGDEAVVGGQAAGLELA